MRGCRFSIKETHHRCLIVFGFCFRQYLYVDEKGKKCKCSAPDYVNLVMSDCQKLIKDESVFPTKYGRF